LTLYLDYFNRTYLDSFYSVQFDWQDAFNLDSQLTDEEKMVRDQFRQYCDDKLMPRVLMANRNEGKGVVLRILAIFLFGKYSTFSSKTRIIVPTSNLCWNVQRPKNQLRQ